MTNYKITRRQAIVSTSAITVGALAAAPCATVNLEIENSKNQKFMKKITILFILISILAFNNSVFSKELSKEKTDKISAEVDQTFEKAIEAGEKLNVDGVAENVNDVYNTGFISNGVYFNTFNQFMTGYRAGVNGLQSQKMNVEKKKITVLSEDGVLLTAAGNFNATLKDGRNISGKFAWTFVYSKIGGEWKVIHSHMSSPR